MNDTVLLDTLAQLAARRIGLRIPGDARDRFAGMLRERAARRGYATLEDYRTFLVGRQATEEWEEFARVFTSGETFFFRDHGQFALLRLRLLPELIERHRGDRELRLWSAGCASGEEAYSLAMLVDMLLPQRDGWNILILGTDIDSEAIAKARRGRYGQWSFRMVPPALRQRYFRPEGGEWLLDERIRRTVTLRVSNLVSEAFPDPGSELHDLDLILCRNVFIYFDSAAVTAVAVKLAATLREGGYLMTAHTELIGHPVRELESRLFVEGVAYQRRVRMPAERLYVPAPPVTAAAAARIVPASPVLEAPNDEVLIKQARVLADRGEYAQAERVCHKVLSIDPLAAAPYFLLAQLAQLRGDFEQAKERLNEAIYLDPRFVAAYLELAALCERADDLPRAQTLRRAALGIVRTMPNDAMIEQYETTAGELMQWLGEWGQVLH